MLSCAERLIPGWVGMGSDEMGWDGMGWERVAREFKNGYVRREDTKEENDAPRIDTKTAQFYFISISISYYLTYTAPYYPGRDRGRDAM